MCVCVCVCVGGGGGGGGANGQSVLFVVNYFVTVCILPSLGLIQYFCPRKLAGVR